MGATETPALSLGRQLPCGPHRWNIWRPRADLALCGVQSLAEARELIEADRLEPTA